MGTNPNLSVGDKAPDFELESDTEGTVALDDLLGEKLVLYFYPQDDTPGCTTQACDFRDNLSELGAEGYKVVGISPDSVESHADFRDKFDLNYMLLADPDHEVADRYGVWREKTTFGNKYMGLVRSTFIIDEEGVIEDIQDNVRATGHVERLIRDL